MILMRFMLFLLLRDPRVRTVALAYKTAFLSLWDETVREVNGMQVLPAGNLCET